MKKQLGRILKGIGYTFLALFAYGFIIGLSQSANNTTASVPVAKPLTQDPTLVADAQELGIDYAPLNWTFATGSLSAEDETGDGTPFIGLFSGPNSIQISPNLSKHDELSIVAYEYMHYAWQGLSASDKSSMIAQLNIYKSQNPDYAADIARYHSPDQTILDDEANATACTRVQSYLLSDDFNAYCNHFIPNRYILF